MKLEMNLNDRDFNLELVKKKGNMHSFLINDTLVELDVVEVENGIYSFLYGGKSYIMEVVRSAERKKYLVSHRCLNFEVEVVDAETKYARARMKGIKANGENNISSPMPGKVVRIPVKEGDQVKEGDTLIVISAMKMESEYKSGKDARVKKIHIGEGDTIEGRQLLLELE